MIKRFLRTCSAAGCRASGLLARAEKHNRHRLTILCFHRVLPADRKSVYYGPDLVVTPRAFRECCRVLRKRFDVRPLGEAVQAWQEPRPSERPLAAITFDDGYRDNHQYAAPILAEFDLRATFFVIADLVGTTEVSWYDHIGRAAMLLHQRGRLSQALEDGALRRTAIGGLDGSSADAAARRTVALAKQLDPAARQRLVDQLSGTAGLDATSLSEDRIMDRGQLEELASAGHEIGSHTRTHEILSLLDDAALENETTGSRQVLEEMLGRPVQSFCYPNGDQDDRVVAAVRTAGYTNAVITEAGNNDPGVDPYRLKRWFIHEERLAGPSGGTSATLLRMELSTLANRVFRRRRLKKPDLRVIEAAFGDSRVKIAYLTSRYPAISHTFILREVRALRARGIHVGTFSIRRPGPQDILGPEAEEEAASTRSLLPMKIRQLLGAMGWAIGTRPRALFHALGTVLRQPGMGVAQRFKWLAYVAEAVVLARALANQGFEHLHCHFGNNGASTGMMAARLAGVSFSLTCHGSELLDARRQRLPEKVAAADFVVCVSQHGKAQLMLRCDPAHWPRLHVIRCGLPMAAARMTDGKPHEPARLLCVGRLSHEKAHLVLLDALAALRERRVPVHCTLIGDGPMRPAIEARSRELALGPMLTLTGSMPPEQVAEHYKGADLVVLPSFSEGIPIVLMEAMMYGRPVVATRAGGVPELIEHGTRGLLVAPGDAEELAAAIGRMLAEPAMARDLALNGSRFVREHFNQDASVPRLIELFEQACRSRTATGTLPRGEQAGCQSRLVPQDS